MDYVEVGDAWRGGGNGCVSWDLIGGERWRLRSQVWMGIEWWHDLAILRPSWDSGLEGCFLEVTGDDAGEPDLAYAQELADMSGLPVAVQFQVPNQPLWEMVEDDLIAHTFERFLDSGDWEWPLLVPMVRSALAAMDALESQFGWDKFLVGGASKRGWTSWLAAASGDRRVKGIVPLVFDNLRMALQMSRQMSLWGRPSERVDDYVRRQLHLIEQSERGDDLVGFVDPWHQLGNVACPALLVNGANDPYWAVDALSVYYGDLPEGSGAVVVPNLGHSTGGREYWGPALSRFSEFVLGGGDWPRVSAEWHDGLLSWSSLVEPVAVKLWTANSETSQFWDASWSKQLAGSKLQVHVPLVGYRAALAEFEFKDDNGFWRLTSPATVLG